MYSAEEIAKKINLILKDKGLSQKEMLEACELNKNTVSSMLYRNSIPRADNLEKIADYLGCSVDYILGRENPTFAGYSNSTSSPFLTKFLQLSNRDQNEILALIDYKLKFTLTETSSPSTDDYLNLA